jgi:DNA replication protein DnaC
MTPEERAAECVKKKCPHHADEICCSAMLDEAELPTIITSNVDLDTVKNLFKGRIYSRFTEMLHLVEFFSVRDYRQDMSSAH